MEESLYYYSHISYLNIRFHGKAITIHTAHSSDDDESLREFVFRTYFRFEPEQHQILDELLKKRFVNKKISRLLIY